MVTVPLHLHYAARRRREKMWHAHSDRLAQPFVRPKVKTQRLFRLSLYPLIGFAYSKRWKATIEKDKKKKKKSQLSLNRCFTQTHLSSLATDSCIPGTDIHRLLFHYSYTFIFFIKVKCVVCAEKITRFLHFVKETWQVLTAYLRATKPVATIPRSSGCLPKSSYVVAKVLWVDAGMLLRGC